MPTRTRASIPTIRTSLSVPESSEIWPDVTAIGLAMIALLTGYEALSRVLIPVAISFSHSDRSAWSAVNVASAWLLSGGRYHGHSHGHAHGNEGMPMAKDGRVRPPNLPSSVKGGSGAAREDVSHGRQAQADGAGRSPFNILQFIRQPLLAAAPHPGQDIGRLSLNHPQGLGPARFGLRR